MTDRISQDKRSENMKKIRSKNTHPEIIVRKYLFSKGLRFRIHSKELPGKPDIVLKKFNTIIFINGCFWHGHLNCKYFKLPKTRSEWWKNKIENNRMRDINNMKKLEKLGWNVLVIYECEINNLNLMKLYHKILLLKR